MAATEPGADPAARVGGGVRPGLILLLAASALVVLAADQLSKWWAVETLPQGEPREILGELLVFRRVENPGAAFSLATGSTWVFSIIAAAVTVFLIVFAPRIRAKRWAVLFGLLLGGTLGNLTDRLFRPPGFAVGHVVDFIQIPLLPAIFNVADSAIVCSMAMFILLSVLGIGLDGRRRTGPASSAG